MFAGVALFWPDLDLQVHLRTLADLLAATERRGDLDALYALGAGALPRCQPGVAACGRDAHALVRDGGVSSRT